MFTTLWDKTCHLWEIACHLLKTAYRLVNFREIFKKCSAEIDGNDQSTEETSLDENEVEKERALADAAYVGNCERIAELFNSGVSLEAKNLNQKLYLSREHLLIPLHIATFHKHDHCVQMLIDFAADVNAKDEIHCTALHLAARFDNYTCLTILLEAGADCNVPTVETAEYEPYKVRYCGGTTALHLAAQYNNVKCIEELIKFGADYNAVDANGDTCSVIPFKSNFNECALTHIKNAHGRTILSLPCYALRDTLLHWVTRFRDLDSVKELLSRDFNVNYLNKEGYTPLHLLCKTRDNYARDADLDFEILNCLVLNGHNTDVNLRSGEGFTALYYSVFKRYIPDNIAFLILNGADINIKEEIKDLTFLEYELKWKLNMTVLSYLVKCMPLLPRLKSLNVYSVCVSLSEHFEEILRSSDLPENVGFTLIRDETDIFVEIIDRGELLKLIAQNSFLINSPVTKCVRYRLQQPLLDIVYERVVKEIELARYTFEKYIHSDISYEVSRAPEDIFSIFKSHLLRLRKQLWYEKLASDPRSLQDCCQYSIRKYIGPMNLKYIKELPLPEKFQSFLKFENMD